MTDSKVSIIVPCYNYAGFIAETLECLQKQSHQHWECIVVDDGSSDNSKEVVQAFVDADARFRYIYQDNQGLPGARNTGIKHATGDFIQFLDSDDLIQERKLELQLKKFEENPDADIVYSGLRYFPDGEVDKLRYSMDWRNLPWTLTLSGRGKDLLKYFITTCPILVPMPLLRKTAIEKVGIFKRTLKSCEDWEFWFRCALTDLNFCYLDQKDTLCLIRMHQSSMTRNRTTMLTSMIEVRALMNTSLSDPALVSWNNKMMLNDKIELAVVKLEHESKAAAVDYLHQLSQESNSWRVRLFSQLVPRIKPSRSLFLLSIVRTLMKKYAAYLG